MGAPRWWDGITTTDAFYQELQARAGDNGVVQVNHPTGSSGMFTQGAYAPATGTVGDPDRFSEAFDAMEVLNDGSYEEFLPYYLDLTARGYAPTPTGVSDAHGYRNGAGANLTWVPLEAAAPADVTPAAFGAAMRAGQVVVSRGPFLDLRVDGAWAPGGTFTGSPTLTVDVRAADWVVVDTLELYRDGALIDTLPYAGSPVELELSGAADAVYVVVGKGSTPMAPVWPGLTPWALGAAAGAAAAPGAVSTATKPTTSPHRRACTARSCGERPEPFRSETSMWRTPWTISSARSASPTEPWPLTCTRGAQPVGPGGAAAESAAASSARGQRRPPGVGGRRRTPPGSAISCQPSFWASPWG
jgi:hypothetical protein